MTETPVDAPASTDTFETRDQFAHASAAALGEWACLSYWQRRAMSQLAPGLARQLYRAELALNLITGDDDAGPDPDVDRADG